jgi:hypothetical protein
MLEANSISFQFRKKHQHKFYLGHQVSAGGGKKMDRIIYSNLEDTLIIHEDKLAKLESEIEKKICEALNQIIDLYLEHLLDKFIKGEGMSHIKNIKIGAVVVFQPNRNKLAN